MTESVTAIETALQPAGLAQWFGRTGLVSTSDLVPDEKG